MDHPFAGWDRTDVKWFVIGGGAAVLAWLACVWLLAGCNKQNRPFVVCDNLARYTSCTYADNHIEVFWNP